MWHGGSEGSGDGVSPPCPQADHLPRQRVQLLVRKSPLLTWNERGTRWNYAWTEPASLEVLARERRFTKEQKLLSNSWRLTKCEQSFYSNVTQLFIRWVTKRYNRSDALHGLQTQTRISKCPTQVKMNSQQTAEPEKQRAGWDAQRNQKMNTDELFWWNIHTSVTHLQLFHHWMTK